MRHPLNQYELRHLDLFVRDKLDGIKRSVLAKEQNVSRNRIGQLVKKGEQIAFKRKLFFKSHYIMDINIIAEQWKQIDEHCRYD